MNGRLHVLLVGIDEYPSHVGPLAGCVNDVDQVHDHLRSSGDPRPLAVEMLKNGEATRDNVVRAFRRHLGRAGAGDVALFHFSGHGARWRSAPAFREFYAEGKDEGLVCIDSREPGGYDLADKELAVLIQEVAVRGVHLAVTLDCCHSGSGTRSADSFRGLRPRVTHEVFDERPLETYLDGHFAKLMALGQPLSIPAARHILLAACERTQLAKETLDNHGVFTATMLEVLEKSGGALSYAELFVRCRAAVLTRADDQLPQFESFGHFDAWTGFLGRPVGRSAQRYSVAFDNGQWRVDGGAIHGVPADPERRAEFTLYPEDGGDDAAAGTARALQVGPQRSVLQLDFSADPGARFRARLSSLPSAPLWLWAEPGSAHHAALEQALAADASAGVALTAVAEAARYAVKREGSVLVVTNMAGTDVIQSVPFDAASPAAAMQPLLSVLEQVAQWERSLALANPATQLDASAIDFACLEPLPKGAPGEAQRHAGPQVVLESVKQGPGEADGWADVHAKLQARNRTAQAMHLMLVYFSPDFGVEILRNDPVPSGDAWITLFGDDPADFFWVGKDEVETIDRFKLIASTERVDGFLLEQQDLERGKTRSLTRALGARKPARKIHGDEWLTKDLTLRIVRRLDALGQKDWVSPNGRITVKGHPRVTASISLGAPPPAGRGVAEGVPFLQPFGRAGLQLLAFGGTRGSADSVLELTNIQHADQLREHPLELVLDVALADDEGVLPFVFDGRHVLLGGQPARDDEGRTHITVDHLHDLSVNRRSLGSALKLYFFKTYLRRGNVNRLRRVDFRDDESVVRHADGVAERVAAAKRVLLLVHGIIGDTDGMAAGVRACGLDRKFDLVLTYDYENLSTPIGETAKQLKADLLAAGLGPGDAQHLTLLVHSMGGLVSRWFIEREDGKAMVDHLVMCGTPNQGSPFGKVDDARKILTMLTGLAANVAPALVPFTAPFLFVLNRSAKVTPTLEQMDRSSAFMQALNASADPGVRYTVLAGNVDDYREPSDPLFAQLVAKMGRSTLFDLLFDRQPNDIAVAVESIFSGAEGRAAASRQPVACHHLNYFSSQTGQAALAKVAWE